MVSRGEWWWLSVEMHGLGGGAYQIMQQAWHGKSPCTHCTTRVCIVYYCVCVLFLFQSLFFPPLSYEVLYESQ